MIWLAIEWLRVALAMALLAVWFFWHLLFKASLGVTKALARIASNCLWLFTIVAED